MYKTHRIEALSGAYPTPGSRDPGLNTISGTLTDPIHQDPYYGRLEVAVKQHSLAATHSSIPRLGVQLSDFQDRSDLIVFMEKLAVENNFSHYMLMPLGTTSRETVISNWPSYLVEFCLSNQLADLAGSRDFQHTDGKTIQFEYDLLRDFPVPDQNNNLHEIINQSGLQRGTGLVCTGGCSTANGLVALFDIPSNVELFQLFLDEFKEIADSISEAIISYCRPSHEVKYKISKRELECIRWTAEGKTSYEISVILNLSENTVNNYIATAAKKVGAVNRSHMICIAARSGIIH